MLLISLSIFTNYNITIKNVAKAFDRNLFLSAKAKGDTTMILNYNNRQWITFNHPIKRSALGYHSNLSEKTVQPGKRSVSLSDKMSLSKIP